MERADGLWRLIGGPKKTQVFSDESSVLRSPIEPTVESCRCFLPVTNPSMTYRLPVHRWRS